MVDLIDPSTLKLFKTEAEWESHIKKLAEGLGWLYYHTWRSDHSTRGFPDCAMVRSPRIIFAELKTDSKRSKLSPSQLQWLSQLSDCPVESYLWRPSDIEEVIKTLK